MPGYLQRLLRQRQGWHPLRRFKRRSGDGIGILDHLVGRRRRMRCECRKECTAEEKAVTVQQGLTLAWMHTFLTGFALLKSS